MNRQTQWRVFAISSLAVLAPSMALACACGCGVFDVGAGTFMPNTVSSGLTLWGRYSFMDQNQNWEGSSKAPAADNSDKEIKTSFFTLGGQYVINRKWSVMAELPIYDRDFTSTDDGTVFGPAGSIYKAHLNAPGDLELMGMYTGISDDMSTGLGLGVKLPTGVWHSPLGPHGGEEFDRDSLPGTGSTDLMVGGYHFGSFGPTSPLSWYVQGRFQAAVATQEGYRAGDEFDSAVGVTYDLGKQGPFAKIAPLLQVLNSYRAHDSGPEADPLNSGYERVLLSPGVEVRLNKVRVYADVEVPVYQHTNAAPNLAIEGTSGQLTAPVLFKVQLAYDF
ncbi:MAG: hypothetical protein ACREEB_06890 [Caulobacteraceae bacterium]